MVIKNTTYVLRYRHWLIPAYLLALLCFIVLLSLVITGFRSDNAIELLSAFGLASYARNTLLVGIPVLLITQILGIGFARLFVQYRFFGRRLLFVLLILPMAIPSYIYAFLGLDMLQYGGTLYKTGLETASFLQLDASYFLLVLSLTLSNYPYVFIFAHTYFSRHSKAMFDATTCLRASSWHIFTKIELPLYKPVITVSSLIIFFEYINEFAAHNYLGYPSLSSVLYKVWYELGSFESAAMMSIILSIPSVIFLSLYLKRSFLNYGTQSHALPKIHPRPTRTGLTALIYIACSALIVVGVVAPMRELVQWSILYIRLQDLTRLFKATINTLSYIGIVLTLTTIVSTITSYGLHLNKRWNAPVLLILLFLPYALPGTVYAISVLATGTSLGMSRLSIGNMNLLFIGATMLRFVSVPLRTTSLALFQRNSRYEEVARSQGLSPHSVFFRLVVPLEFPFIVAASLFVVLDLIRELPITLALRTIQFESIAVYIYTLVENAQIHSVALPSLVLVTIGLIASSILSQRTV